MAAALLYSQLYCWQDARWTDRGHSFIHSYHAVLTVQYSTGHLFECI